MMFDMKFAVTGADEPMVSKMDEIVFVMEVSQLGGSCTLALSGIFPGLSQGVHLLLCWITLQQPRPQS